MNAIPFISLFAAALVALTGAFVFFRNTRSALNRLFFLLALSISWWAFTEFEQRSAQSRERAQFWMMAGSLWPLSIALLYKFAALFTGRLRRGGLLLGSVAMVWAPAVVFTLLHLVVFPREPHQTPWGWANASKGEAFSSLWVLVLYGWAIAVALVALYYCLVRYYRAAAIQSRKMAKHVLLGISVPILAGIVSEILLPAFGRSFPELTASSATFMCLFFGWAIWRHELFALSPATAAESIVSTMSDPLFLVDADQSIRTVNNAALRLLCYQEHELVGSPVTRVFAPLDDHENEMPDFRSLLNTGSLSDIEVALYTRDGAKVPVSLSWTPTRARDGKILGTTFIARDITERLRLQESLRASHEDLENRIDQQTQELRLSNKLLRDEIGERMSAEEGLAAEKEHLSVTLRSIGDGVITTNRGGEIVLMNKAAEWMTGWTSEEAQGKPLGKVFSPIDTAHGEPCSDPVELILKSEDITSLGQESMLLSRDGTQRVISDIGAPIRDRSGKVVGTVLVLRDITERKKLEDELFKTRKLESIAVLADGIAHNFNNILTSITTNLFVARMSIPRESEAWELLSETEKATFKASSLTRQLLTFSKGAVPIRERCEVGTIVEEAVGYCLSESAVEYELEIPENIPAVELDRGLIDQALTQIIKNAEEAVGQGSGVRISVMKTEVDRKSTLSLKPGDYVVVTVADSGSGIPVELVQKIFDPYYTTKADHVGLGLTTAYSIVRKHDGYIDLTSTPGKGSTFRVYLPAAPCATHGEDDTQNGVKRGKGNILLMDDEEYIIRSTTKLLSHLGYRAEGAATGEAALEAYQRAREEGDPFDLVILDLLVAAGMGGKETMEKLREIDPDVKAFISSGYVTDPVIASYADYGFCGVILKPYNVEELSGIISSAVSGS